MKKFVSRYQEEVSKILNALVAYNPQKVILFGSAARSEAKKGSDLDLFVVKETKRRFTERAYDVVSNYLSRIDYQVPVDIIVYTPSEFKRAKKENRIFLEKILKEGKVLYEKT